MNVHDHDHDHSLNITFIRLLDNIRGVVNRGENIDTLHQRSEELQNSSSQFSRQAKDVRMQMFWKDMKTRLLLGGVILVVVGAVIGLIIWGTGVGSNS